MYITDDKFDTDRIHSDNRLVHSEHNRCECYDNDSGKHECTKHDYILCT